MKFATCQDARGVRQDQLPGRFCGKNNNKCQSLKCFESSCYGYPIDTSCNSHADCKPETYCNQLSYWPYLSVCTAYRKDDEICEEDSQCPISHYCWYKSVAEKKTDLKRCLRLFSAPQETKFGWQNVNGTSLDPTLIDFTTNGKYCASGLAINTAADEAKCVNATGIF